MISINKQKGNLYNVLFTGEHDQINNLLHAPKPDVVRLLNGLKNDGVINNYDGINTYYAIKSELGITRNRGRLSLGKDANRVSIQLPQYVMDTLIVDSKKARMSKSEYIKHLILESTGRAI